MLTCHPKTLGTAAVRVEAEAVRTGASALLLSYFVLGNLETLNIPAKDVPARAAGLWQHTCFEAFLKITAGHAYYEFNFAPSLRWAAYRFESYREGMRIADEIRQPQMEAQRGDTSFEFQVALDLAAISELPEDTWRLALSAVIEEANGHKSYWALVHPVGKPDFHHPASFALEIPAE